MNLSTRAALSVAGALTLIGASSAVTAAAEPAAAPSSTAPQCFTVRIVQAAPAATLWVKFCGTGPGGTSPLEEGVSGHGPLIVDGGDLKPSDCLRAAPCVLLWPASPAS